MFKLIKNVLEAISRRFNMSLNKTRIKNKERFIRRHKMALIAHTLKRENYLMPDYMAETIAIQLYETSKKNKFGKVVTQKG